MLVKVDAEISKINASSQGSVKGTYEGDRKSDGKANLQTTNEIVLEAGNEILFPVLQWSLLLPRGATEETKERLKRRSSMVRCQWHSGLIAKI